VNIVSVETWYSAIGKRIIRLYNTDKSGYRWIEDLKRLLAYTKIRVQCSVLIDPTHAVKAAVERFIACLPKGIKARLAAT